MGRIAKEVLKQIKKGADEAVVVRPGQEPKKAVDDVVEELGGAKPADDVQAPDAPEAPVKEPIKEPQPAPDAPAEPVAEKPVPVAEQPEAPRVPKEESPVVASVDEAEHLAKATLDTFDTNDSFQPNFDTFETTDDVTAVIADLAERNKGRIDESRRGTITEDELRGLSEDLDIEEDVVRSIMEREVGSLDNINAEKIVAARQVLQSSAQRIKDLAKKIVSGEGSDIDRLKFRRQLLLQREFTNNFLENFMGVRAEAGRLLNAFGVPTEGLDVDIAHLREMVENAGGHDTDRIAQAISLMDEPSTGQVSSLARKYTQSKFMGVVNEVFVNSILSGPKTHAINVSGNITMQMMGAAETAVAARIGRFLSTQEGALVGEASALIHGTLGGFRDAAIVAGRTARTGIALDDVVKFESVRRRSITAEHLIPVEYRHTPLGRALGVLLDGYQFKSPIGKDKTVTVPGLGQTVRAPTERVMLPADEFFKTAAYRAELERLTFREAHRRVATGEMELEDVAAFARDFMENPPTNIQKVADDYTRYVTFQNPLGDFGQKAQLLLRSKPVLSLIAPFVRTPANIFTAGILERSPLAFARAEFRRVMKAGGEERDRYLARAAMGSLTSAYVAKLVVDGTVTGGGPSNPDARRVLELSGWKPYSFRIADPVTGEVQYHSYQRMEPLAFVIGATADSVEIMEALNNMPEGFHDEERSRVMTEIVPSIMTGVANNTLSKTYLQGVVDFIEAASDPQRYMSRYVERMATSIVPFSAARRQVAGMDDPYLREARGLIDQLKVNSGIPGWSENAPPSRDVFGAPRFRAAGQILGTASPIPDSKEKDDPVVRELIGIMQTTRRVPITMPFGYAEGMRLSTEEYDQLVVLARSELQINGRNFYDTLDRTIGSSAYLRSTPDSQVDLLKSVQRNFDQLARDVMEKENTMGFGDRLADWRQIRQELKFGE